MSAYWATGPQVPGMFSELSHFLFIWNHLLFTSTQSLPPKSCWLQGCHCPSVLGSRATWETVTCFGRLPHINCKLPTRSSLHLTFFQGQTLASDLTHFALWRNPTLLTELISTLGKKYCVQTLLSGFSFLLSPSSISSCSAGGFYTHALKAG